ncbi:MAG: class I SAM-dependent methyltransferase [Magnetococcales bacterium]|nr:class I SAM-dependent methyltransferase [Magnetococcales bacterium]
MAIWAASPAQWSQATLWADRLSLPLVAEPSGARLLLVVTDTRLELRSVDPEEGGAIYVDFVGGKGGFRRAHGGGLRQPLARAVGLRGNRPLRILDATPGLGQDALVLAALGGVVQMVERSPVVAALLADGLRRLAEGMGQTDALALTLVQADARRVLEGWSGQEGGPDVVYLDPMYPHRDGSALSKKEMRRLRVLVGDDGDAAELLAVALTVARQRVVVKRPRLAPVLGGQPTMAIGSKNTRFDVYLIR